MVNNRRKNPNDIYFDNYISLLTIAGRKLIVLPAPDREGCIFSLVRQKNRIRNNMRNIILVLFRRRVFRRRA